MGLRPDKIEGYRSPLFQPQPMKLNVTALTTLLALTGSAFADYDWFAYKPVEQDQ